VLYLRLARSQRLCFAQVRVKGDSCGGVVTCVCRNVPRGLGAPVFDKLEADLAHAMLSLPATKGFEVGSGFSGTLMKGTEHNDEFYLTPEGLLRTRTNRSGGIQGGISNGENVVLRVAFKPTSTVTQPQRTVTRAGEETELRARGRHDPCVVPRAVPMVEAMAALVLVDHLLQQQAQCMLLGRDVAPELLYGNMPTLFDQQAARQASQQEARLRAASAKEQAAAYSED
jgi:chorismate synthase